MLQVRAAIAAVLLFLERKVKIENWKSKRQRINILTMNDYQPSKRASFMYFAYGSNLWTNRIRLQNPSAIRKTIATLKVWNRRRLARNSEHCAFTIFVFRFRLAGISIGFLSSAQWAHHLEWFIGNDRRRWRSRCMGNCMEIDLTHMASLDWFVSFFSVEIGFEIDFSFSLSASLQPRRCPHQ